MDGVGDMELGWNKGDMAMTVTVTELESFITKLNSNAWIYLFGVRWVRFHLFSRDRRLAELCK